MLKKKIISDNNLEKRISLIDKVSYQDLPYYYSSADLFIMPSTDRAEAFGLVAVEAMACGLPVISTELGTGTSFHNIHNVTGKIINPNSVKELKDAIIEVDRENIIKNKSEIVKRADYFSLEKFNLNFIKFIREINRS